MSFCAAALTDRKALCLVRLRDARSLYRAWLLKWLPDSEPSYAFQRAKLLGRNGEAPGSTLTFHGVCLGLGGAAAEHVGRQSYPSYSYHQRLVPVLRRHRSQTHAFRVAISGPIWADLWQRSDPPPARWPTDWTRSSSRA